jgi:chaperone LolA
MKRSRWAGVACLALVLSGAVLGQTAEGILEKARKKYDALTDAELRFVQTVKFPVSNLEQRVSGLLRMKKTNRYRMETDEMVVVTDGETVWSYSRLNNQVLIDRFKMDERMFSPERILTAAPAEFSATLIGKEKIAAQSTIVLKLIPSADQGFIKVLKLWIGEADHLTHKVEMVDANGKETTYLVSDLRTNTGLSDTLFSYTAPENAEVVDLR